MKFKQLINVHSHTHYSLDGASTVKQIVDRNFELGATYTAVTEHGNMNSGIDLYHTCKSYKKGKMNPILGIELYMQPPFIDEIRKEYTSYYRLKNNKDLDKSQAEKIEKKIQESYVHLTVHFKDEAAYQYFCRLTPKMEERAVIKVGERKPVCTIDELHGIAGHITICSSCLIGFVGKFLAWKIEKEDNFKRPDLATKAYHILRDIAGKDDFFIEIFPHTVDHNWKAGAKDGSTQGCFEPIKGGDLQLEPNNFIRALDPRP